ncbi:M48 family metalloprotease [Yoonia sp.]|uniref:M48 family metalloprotease n=1 Tax=Yoonia sp. TaxID=2212373 RepID=UPI002391AF8F|nr:M48 family metalloprotease [Yoonia sp.]MDE0851603.1 M48 family metalloprotease [Yoonia sp.]
MRHLPVLMCCILSACAAPAGRELPDGETLPKAPITVNGPNSVLATSRASVQSALESFASVIRTVEPVAEAECRARTPQTNCDFRIVIDDRPGSPPNAYQTLDDDGRPIIAFTIPLIVDVLNRDEMAFILSHEAAHHIEGHLLRQRQNADFGAVIFGQMADVIGGSDPDTIQAAQEFGAALGARTYSKDFELEADALGTVIAAKAGYNPLRGAEFFFRIPDPGNSFLGTHPANADRLAIVQRTAAQFGF